MTTLMTGVEILDSENMPRRHRITAADYCRMAEVGLFAPDARVELIDGEILDMAPIGDRHNATVDWLNRHFNRAVGDHAIVRTQGSTRLGDMSMPQPDLALLVPREDFYKRGGVSPSVILLIVEVGDSTLRFDRDVKIPLYARHGIPEAWIVDLQHDELRVYRSPRDGVYCDQSVTAIPGVVYPVALPETSVDLTDLFR